MIRMWVWPTRLIMKRRSRPTVACTTKHVGADVRMRVRPLMWCTLLEVLTQ